MGVLYGPWPHCRDLITKKGSFLSLLSAGSESIPDLLGPSFNIWIAGHRQVRFMLIKKTRRFDLRPWKAGDDHA